MDQYPQTIGQRRSSVGQGRAPAAPGRPSPKLVRAAASSVGWSGALEVVADALEASSLGRLLAPGQAEEKWGAAEFHIQRPPCVRREDARFRDAWRIPSWGAPLTRAPCAQDGPPDVRLGRVGAWWITLGKAAWRDVASASEACHGQWREVLARYAGWVRPPAEERT